MWVCTRCTLENVSDADGCAACFALAEWVCRGCDTRNKGEVGLCGRCDLPRDASLAAAAAAAAAPSAPPEALVAQSDADNRARQECEDEQVARVLAASFGSAGAGGDDAAGRVLAAQQDLLERAGNARARQEQDDAEAARALAAADAAEAAQTEATRRADEAEARKMEAEEARKQAEAQHLARVKYERDERHAEMLQAAYDREAQDGVMAAQLQDEEGCGSATCRFCDRTCAQPRAKKGVEAPSCQSAECWQKDRVHCPALLGCGHPCVGTRGEQVHPQKCQHDDCCGEGNQDECAICFDVLTEFPCVQLGCGHVYHHPCLLRQIDSAKDSLVPGKQISFNLLGCPQCKVVMQADAIRDEMAPAAALVQKVDAEAKRVAEHEEPGLLALSEADFQRETHELFMFFLCKEPGCGKVFCGGRQACADAGAAGQGDAGAAPAAVCPDCQLAAARRAIGKLCQEDPPHPSDNLVRKCNFCCDVATFCCNLNGPIYMCTACHTWPYDMRDNAAPCDPSKCAMRKLGKSYASFG